MSTADYQRAWRAKHGARTGHPGPPITNSCGTPAAYNRHLRHNETPCDLCRQAWAEYQRERRQRTNPTNKKADKAS